MCGMVCIVALSQAVDRSAQGSKQLEKIASLEGLLQQTQLDLSHETPNLETTRASLRAATADTAPAAELQSTQEALAAAKAEASQSRETVASL